MKHSAGATRREFLKMVAAGSAGLALGRGPAVEGYEGAKMRKPNILFLMTDQHRADCVGCDGNRVIKTPNLDRIARDGVRFIHAYSSTPTCTPARAAILTGLSPWHHGMLGFGRIAERYPFELPRAMADAGYYTFAIGKLHYHPQRNYHGFHGALLDESGRVESPDFVSDYRKWFKEKAPGLDPDATGIGWNSYLSAPYALPEELHPTRWTGDRAVEFISRYDRPEPFFLKVSFARPHSPYDAPRRFWDMYNEDDMPPPHVGDWAGRYAPIDDPADLDLWHGDLGIKQVKRSRHGYYGNVTFIDEQVGRILKALEDRGMLENTLILFTSDHGDMLGDHHLWRKSYAYEGSARVSMLIRWPDALAPNAERGRVLSQPVELRDLLPTFLDAAGARIPDNLDGDSMLKLIRGDTSGWRDWIDLEHGTCYAKENTWNALTDGRWKYIYHAFDGREQLFDLRTDPGETRDLAGDPSCSNALKGWRERMVKHLSERGEEYVRDGKLVPRPQRIVYGPMFPGKRS
ncbi:MAG: arylsulfatase [Armatimonadota bacterium]